MPTVRQLAVDYLRLKEAEFKGGLLSAESMLRLHTYLGDFCLRLGDREAASIRPSDLTVWILSHAGWKSPHTRQDAARTVRGLFVWAEDEDRIVKNPLRRFRKCWDTPQPRGAIKPAEVRAVMLAAKTKGRGPSRGRFRLGMYFLWQTGARTSEMRALRFEHIDLAAGVIRMRSKSTRATGRLRLIPLSPGLLWLFRWMLRRRRPAPGDYVFVNGKGEPWTRRTFGRLFRAFADAAGVRPEVSAYCLRHGLAVSGLEAGIGSQQLADCLGHSTLRYLEWYGRDARNNADYLKSTLAEIHKHRRKEK